MASTYIFTSEAVTSGHPDKLCDQISDELVGCYLQQDALAQTIVECAVSTGILFVSVKAAAEALVDIPGAARRVIRDAGYNRGSFTSETCTVMTSLGDLTPTYPRVDETGLSDAELDRLIAQENVTLFGYACTHTPALLPLPIWCARRLVQQMDAMRKQGLDYLTPDGKCQVGVEFLGRTPHRIDSITLIASQYDADYALEQVRADLLEQVIQPVFAADLLPVDDRTCIQINPEGTILEAGPDSHAGLTGRKNGGDTYGGFSRQSGAALSGKDPSRIDRIGAYAARHAAKNVVAAGLATECEVQLSYSIGQARPVSVRVDTAGTGQIADDELTARIGELFDFRPGGIIRRFDLRNLARASNGQLYRRLASYGHVGRLDLELPWEDTSAAAALAG